MSWLEDIGSKRKSAAKGDANQHELTLAIRSSAVHARRMRRTLTACALCFLCVGSVVASDWRLLKLHGRDYVTLENVAEFYGLDQVQRVNNAVTLSSAGRSIRGKAGSNEVCINNLKFILSYPLAESGGKVVVSRMDLTKVIEPVLRPSRIRNAELIETIVLDPGHGGDDHGARSSFGSEKIFTLKVARELEPMLAQQGYKVVLTRHSDRFVSLDDRVRTGNRFSKALFVSIHFNAGPDHASGVETYTLAPRGVPSTAADGPRVSDFELCRGNARDGENMALATAAHAALVANTRLFDRGIKRARFVVLRNLTIPGVLIEGGFLSNKIESRKVAATAFQRQIAASIAQAIANYREAIAHRPGLIAAQTATGGATVLRSTRNEPLVITPTSR